MARGFLRGHPIEFGSEGWVFADTGEPTTETWQDRPCGHCGLRSTPEGHDGCIPNLRGVKNACCGHGEAKGAYIQFWDSKEDVRGQDALDMFDSLRTDTKRREHEST